MMTESEKIQSEGQILYKMKVEKFDKSYSYLPSLAECCRIMTDENKGLLFYQSLLAQQMDRHYPKPDTWHVNNPVEVSEDIEFTERFLADNHD